MNAPSPVARFFAALDRLYERTEQTWWGAVVTDSRYPDIRDVNYARVDVGQPDLQLEEVEAALLPSLRESGARYGHVVAFDANASPRLLQDLERAGRRVSWDAAMRFAGTLEDARGSGPVEALEPGQELWRVLDVVYREFGNDDERVREQLIAITRDVLEPAGRRWFGVSVDGRVAGVGSIHVLDHVGYVYEVLTMPAYRRRGIAGAVVRRLVHEGFHEGAREVVLLSDAPNAIRLYRTIGFEDLGRLAASVWELPEASGQASGSSGSAAGAAGSSPTDPGAGSLHGDQPG